MKPLIIGMGNPYRSDDGIGQALLHRLQPALHSRADTMACHGDPSGLLSDWLGREQVIVVDSCCHSGADPGTIFRFDGLHESLPTGAVITSSHAFNLSDAIALGRQLNVLPESLTIYAVVGDNFDLGNSLSKGVTAALERLSAQILMDLNFSDQRIQDQSCTNSLC